MNVVGQQMSLTKHGEILQSTYNDIKYHSSKLYCYIFKMNRVAKNLIS